MSQNERRWTDQQVEQIVGNLLRTGVLLAAAVVLAGGVWFLVEHGAGSFNYHDFNENKWPELHTLRGVVAEVRQLRSRGIIQLGLLLLIATPVARVIFTIFAFVMERDRTYVIVTLIVLTVLLYSLFWGKLG